MKRQFLYHLDTQYNYQSFNVRNNTISRTFSSSVKEMQIKKNYNGKDDLYLKKQGQKFVADSLAVTYFLLKHGNKLIVEIIREAENVRANK